MTLYISTPELLKRMDVPVVVTGSKLSIPGKEKVACLTHLKYSL